MTTESRITNAWWVAALASIASVAAIGWAFGLLIGTSAVPMASTAAPLVFGLLAVVGVGAASSTLWWRAGKEVNDWDRVVVALAVITFCVVCLLGIRQGGTVHRYRTVGAILKEAGVWGKLPPDAYAQIEVFSAVAIQNGLPPINHDNLIRCYIAPTVCNPDLKPGEWKQKIDDLIDNIAPAEEKKKPAAVLSAKLPQTHEYTSGPRWSPFEQRLGD